MLEQLFIRKMSVSALNDRECLFVLFRRNDGSKGIVAPDPHLRRIDNPFSLQFERAAVVDVRAGVFGIR